MMQEPTLPQGYSLAAFDTLDSTNSELKRRVAQGEAPDRLVVWAIEQTKGRGRRGRSWSGPAGNLMCSILLRANCSLPSAAQLGFVAALAVLDTVRPLLPGRQDIALKWPNDVLVGGRKVSGILLEAGGWMPGAPGWVVVGTGINLMHHPGDTEWPATDVRTEGGRAATAVQALEAYCGAFERWSACWSRDGFEPIRQEWMRNAYGLGDPIVARVEAGTITGRMLGIDPDGSLVLESDAGTECRLAAADILPAEG